MKKYLKLIYFILTMLYIVLSVFEINSYFSMYSNLFGAVYLIITLLIIFLLFRMLVSFKKKNIIILIIVVIGLLCSYVLPNVVNVMTYVDDSNSFINNNNLIISVFKPIIYAGLFIFSVIEYKITKH